MGEGLGILWPDGAEGLKQGTKGCSAFKLWKFRNCLCVCARTSLAHGNRGSLLLHCFACHRNNSMGAEGA